MEELRWFNFESINLVPIYALAYVLAAFSYYLGCILLNIPHRGMKRAGWVLIYDGASYFIILAIVMFAPSIVKLGYLLTDTSPEPLFKSLDTFLGFAPDGSYLPASPLVEIKKAYTSAGTILLAVSIPPIIGRAMGTLMWSYLRPTLALLAIVYATLHLIYFLGWFVRTCWPLFMAFGALIYGLPARIGRALGAALIAFSIIFAIELPLLPNFVASFSLYGAPVGPTLNADEFLSNAGKIFIVAKEYNETYNRLLSPNVVFVCKPAMGSPNNYLVRLSNGTEEWRLLTSRHGEKAYALPPGRYDVVGIEYMKRSISFSGTKQFTIQEGDAQATPVSITLNIYGFSVECEGLSSPAYIDLDLSREVLVNSVQVSDKKVAISVHSTSNSSKLYSFFTKDTELSWQLDGDSIAPSQAFSNEYGSLYAVYMLEGKHTLSLAVHSTKPLEINEEEYDPLEGQRGTRAKAILEVANDTLIPFFDLSATFFLTYFILPILFLLVLGLLTTGLGRALGGRGLPIPGL